MHILKIEETKIIPGKISKKANYIALNSNGFWYAFIDKPSEFMGSYESGKRANNKPGYQIKISDEFDKCDCALYQKQGTDWIKIN
jgi:hypothetical protein